MTFSEWLTKVDEEEDKDRFLHLTYTGWQENEIYGEENYEYGSKIIRNCA
jgi:hypothetical protein